MRAIRPWAASAIAVLVLLATGCDNSESSAGDASTDTASTDTAIVPPATAPSGGWGSYPADTTLDESEVVEKYVQALSERDGETFCRLVAPWISGRLDIAGTDPDESLLRPLRCPELVPVLTDFPWENKERDFKSAVISELGDLEERRPDLVSVPVTISLRLEEEGRGEYDEPLEDVVWLARDAGAWRVAKLSRIAAWAALTSESELELTSPPDVAAERRRFAAEVAKARRLRSDREESYRVVATTASCAGAKSYPDIAGDVVDYRHPAPPTPTPQLGAADIRAVEVSSRGGRICIVFVLAGAVRTGTTFTASHETQGADWSTSGFAQFFEVELRHDGRARVTSGRTLAGRTLSVPARVGVSGSRLMLVLNEDSFRAGRPAPMSRERRGRPLASFQFIASSTVSLNDRRSLHDDLGPGPPEGIRRYAYP